MSVRVRLTRVGNKKNPIWRVVVADQRSPRDGRSIETLGHYNPQTQPSTIVINRERLDFWLDRGAQPTGTVKKLLRAPNTEIAAAVQPEAPVAEAPSEPEAEPEAPAEAEAPAEVEAEAPAEADAPASEPDSGAPAAEADAASEPDTGSQPDPEAPAPESA